METIEDIIKREDLSSEEKHKCFKIYLEGKKKFKKEYGSCLEADDYYECLQKRDKYCLTLIEVYLREHKQ